MLKELRCESWVLFLNTIKELGVENANVKVVDKGALNYALIARTKAAVYRAAESHDYKF